MIITVMGRKADGTMVVAEMETDCPKSSINVHQQYLREEMGAVTPVFGVIVGGKK